MDYKFNMSPVKYPSPLPKGHKGGAGEISTYMLRRS